ncbi:MAG: hypothetical protein C5B49_13855 [Bdellovibrio sp.]|nr:MAG: hypothetical protein C5B49_13855 [Bdellovibrio sp.]
MQTPTPHLKSMAHNAKRLDFDPLGSWPSGLPGVAINGWIVAGFDRKLFLDYEVADSSAFVSLFASLYPHLSFSELANFYQCAEAYGPSAETCGPSAEGCDQGAADSASQVGAYATSTRGGFAAHAGFGTSISVGGEAATGAVPLADLLIRYGYRDFESFRKMARLMGQTPPDFKKWAARRQSSLQELAILLNLPIDEFSPCLAELARQQLTRQEGAQALELAAELFLLGRPVAKILSENSQPWLNHLKALRYPMSSSRDNQAREWVNEQRWPRQSQIRWVRQGDQTGLEVRLVLRQPRDLARGVQDLHQINEILEKAPRGMWGKN